MIKIRSGVFIQSFRTTSKNLFSMDLGYVCILGQTEVEVRLFVIGNVFHQIKNTHTARLQKHCYE